MTTIPQLYDAIQQVNAGVRGVQFAPKSTQVPAQLTGSQLPAALLFYGIDDWSKFGNVHFEIDVYVAPVGSSTPTQAMLRCLTLADAFRQTWLPLSNVAGIPIARATWSGTKGFGTPGVHKTLGYNGVEYFGFTIQLPFMGVDL